MKRVMILVALMITSAAAFAATPGPAPDFSRDAILKVLHEADREEARKLRLDVGQAEYRTKSTRYRFAYLPFLASLPYAGPQGARFLPNPFVLTGMQFPYGPHQYAATPLDFERSADEQREFRRVMRILRQRQRVVVTP